jgi:molecular chaperone DnaK (HSP70)
MENFITIDLGTTTCRVAYHKGDGFEIIRNRFSDGKVPLILKQPKGIPFSISFSSIKQEIGFEEEVMIDGKKIRVIDFMSDIFKAIKSDVMTNLGKSISNLVLTVPPGFSERQRAAMKTAAGNGGFTFVRLLDESTALILGAGIKDEGKVFLVYSLGGGDFNVSVYRITNGFPKPLCHEGERNLGGYNFDASILHHLFNISKEKSILSSLKYSSIYKLKSLAEQIKIGLSKREQVEIDLDLNDYFDMGLENSTQNRFKNVLSRPDFETIISNDLEKTFSLTNKTIQNAGLAKDDIESIILDGGSTRIPYIEKKVSEIYGKKILRLPHESILKGANIYGIELTDTILKESCKIDKQCEESSLVDKDKISNTPRLQNKFKNKWLSDFPENIMNAQSLWTEGRQDKSIAVLEGMAVQLSIFIGNMHSSRGQMLMKMNNLNEAMMSFEEALKYIKDDKDVRRFYHKACSSKGAILANNGRLSEAAMIIKKGLSLKPECVGCGAFLKKIEDGLKIKRYPGTIFVSKSRSKKKKS